MFPGDVVCLACTKRVRAAGTGLLARHAKLLTDQLNASDIGSSVRATRGVEAEIIALATALSASPSPASSSVLPPASPKAPKLTARSIIGRWQRVQPFLASRRCVNAGQFALWLAMLHFADASSGLTSEGLRKRMQTTTVSACIYIRFLEDEGFIIRTQRLSATKAHIYSATPLLFSLLHLATPKEDA